MGCASTTAGRELTSTTPASGCVPPPPRATSTAPPPIPESGVLSVPARSAAPQTRESGEASKVPALLPPSGLEAGTDSGGGPSLLTGASVTMRSPLDPDPESLSAGAMLMVVLLLVVQEKLGGTAKNSSPTNPGDSPSRACIAWLLSPHSLTCRQRGPRPATQELCIVPPTGCTVKAVGHQGADRLEHRAACPVIRGQREGARGD